MERSLGRVIGLVLGGVLGATACSSVPGAAESWESIGTLAAPLLRDHARCAPGRLESTLGKACALGDRYVPVAHSAALGASIGTPTLDVDRLYNVQLSSAAGTEGQVDFMVPAAGEFVLYLSTPNVLFRLTASDGTDDVPACSRYLPLEPVPPGYDPNCDGLLRGAYAINLGAGKHRLELGPVQHNSAQRIALMRRTNTAYTSESALPACDLSATLSDACAAAGTTAPVSAKPFGSAPLPSVMASNGFGIRLEQRGEAYEGAVNFTPPYTGDYTVYVGTPQVGLATFDDGWAARSAVCSSPIAADSCAALRAAFTFRRLVGGVAHRLELGPISPQSWVRTIIVPTAPDSDGDGVSDTYDGAHRVARIAAGGDSTCALSESGDVKCWGLSLLGGFHRVGDDETPATEADVDLGTSAVQVAVGAGFTCIVSVTGGVRCWGSNEVGQLGYGHTRTIGDDETPASAGDIELGGVAVQVAAGWSHTCALLDTGAVRCWGSNTVGQLGYGHTRNIGDDETPASAGDVDLGGFAVQIAASEEHTCALLDTGAVRCWGAGGFGFLGYGNEENIGDDESPASAGDVPLGGSAVQIALGHEHSCALLDTGGVRCWGEGSLGALGYGNTDYVGAFNTPASAGDVPLGGSAVQITAGYWHTCALLDTGFVRCWGVENDGVLGYGNLNRIGDDETPASAGDIDLGGFAVQLASGHFHNCVLLDTGSIRCWGSSSDGQLGYGNSQPIGDDEAPASAGEVQVY